MVSKRNREEETERRSFIESPSTFRTPGRPPIENVLDALRTATGRDPVKSGDGWKACCPAHDDHNPSLSVSEGDDGRVLLNCLAGCSIDDVLAAARLTMRDLFPDDRDSASASMSMKPHNSRKPAGFHGRQQARKRSSQNAPVFASSREAIQSLESRLGKRAAVWTYHDADGNEAGCMIRWDLPDGGKTIRPIWCSDDGWSVGGMPEPRPLYRLPCLSQPGIVYVAEGEKAADAGVAIGHNVTTSASGCESPAKTDWSPLAGRDVVILPDNDDAGEKYAETVAGILTKLDPPATVRIVRLRDLWPELPEKGDLDDWYEAHIGVEPDMLRAQLDTLTASVEPWKPERQRPTIESFEPFPVVALPQVVRTLVTAGSDAIGCDPAFIALPVLSVLGASIGNTRRLRLKPGWDVPPIIWTAIVGRSGSQKSPAWKLALSAVNELEKEADRRWRREMAEYQAAVAEQKRIRRTDDDPAESEKPTEQPIAERFVVSDTTIEALAPLLLENPRGLLLTVDELVGWLGSFDRFNRAGRASADAGRWLSMFNAAPLRVDRKTGEPKTIYVPSAAVSVCGGIQPGTLRKAIGTEHRENGLLARMLLAYPPPRSRRWSEAAIRADSVEPFTELLRSLRHIEFERDRFGEPVPGIVNLTDAAKRLFRDFYNEHAQEQETLDDDLAAAWSKLEEYAARLALIAHLARYASGEDVAEREVDEVSMAAGIELTRWFCREARRVYAVLDQSEAERARHELADWIRRKGGEVSVPDVQGGHRRFRTAIQAEAALDELVDAGYGEWQPVKTTRRGGRPSRRFVLSAD